MQSWKASLSARLLFKAEQGLQLLGEPPFFEAILRWKFQPFVQPVKGFLIPLQFGNTQKALSIFAGNVQAL